MTPATVSPRSPKEDLASPDPIPVSPEELAQIFPDANAPEPQELDLLAPENLDAYILAKEADDAAGGPGFFSRMGDAAVDLVKQVGMAGKLTGQNVLSATGAAITADGEELKSALRRQTAFTTQAAASLGGSFAMTGETVKGAFKEVGTKLSVGYQDTPENRRRVYAVRQANDRSMRDVQGVIDDALLIADNFVSGLDLNTAYAPAERETMLRAAGGAAEVLDVAFTAGAAAGAKLGAKVATRSAMAAERAATSVGAEKVAELISNSRKYASSIPETLYRVAAETAGNKMPNFGALMDSAKRLAVLQEERALIEAAEDSVTRTKALSDNASKISELRTQIERMQSEFVRRADDAALELAKRPITQQLAAGAVETAGDVLSGAADRVQRGIDWLRNKRAGALGTSGEAVQAGDEVFERVAGVSPSMVERTAGWFNDLGENVSAAGRLMRTMESSTPYFQRLAKETDGWTRFAAQNANRVEFVARLGRGAAEGIDGAVKGATVGGVFGLLQGDSAEGAGEGLVGGFFGGGLRTIRMERDPGMVRARQLGDIADARSRRTGLQQQLFDAAPRNLQLAASTFEATNPNLVVNFVRQKGSGGSYRVNPDGTGEATIDLDSKIPLVPLLAHEVSHHIARNPDIASDLKRRFLGDEATGTPGFLTEMRDGTLQPKPEFQKFRDEYLSALRRAGKDTAAYEANPELILHEVIAEAGVSSLLATNASGEFAGIAALRRNARPIAQAMEQFARSEMVINSGVLQRALMATGAVFTDGGQHAKGTGLFSTDMSPELRSAVNQIIGEYDRMALSERGGQVESFSETPTIYSEQEIASNPELLDLVSSGFDVDVDPKTGKRKFLSAREAKKREQEFVDDLIQALDASPDLSPGRVRAVTTKDGRTIYSGKYIPADVLETLQSRNKYNPRQLETLAMVTDLLGKRPGNEVHFVYQPAMTRGSRLYKQRAVTNRVETPISILISKTGGVLINTLSQEKVLRNLEFFSRKGMLGAWGGDVRAARADLLKYIDNTVAGREGAEGLGLEKRDALNALFGQLTNVQKERNPVLQGMSDTQGRKIGVVQSRRIDRVNQMKVLDSAFRADYGRVSENLRPDVLPIPERFTGTGEEGDRQSKKVDAPGFFKRFDIQEYTKGGKYFDVASGEDVTGRVYSSGSIDVSSGKPSLRASDTRVEAPTSGRKIRTNLFKQSAGWKWVGEAPVKTSTLVSVEMGKDHLYTLTSQFDTPVEMARYEDKKSEPRLRPTTRGVLRVGEKVGEIEVRGRIHPVYDKITTATDAPGRGIINRGEDSLQFRPEANDETTRIAAEYVRNAFGREYEPHTVYDEAPEARLKEIADYFQNVAKHQPDAPDVLRSYRAMADETIEQYRAMIAAGIKPEPYKGKGEPYASSEEMMRDVRENKHLYFLRTDNAFGQGTQDVANPLLEKSGLKIGDFELLVNDVFRVVHDYFGHTQQGLQFGPRGEFNAWKSHSRMYSEEAQGAVAAETLAQNAWVNFGAHLRRADGSIPKKGEEGYVPPQERPFGDQKNFVVPADLMQFRPDEIGFYSQLERTLAAIPAKASRQQIEAALRDGVKEKGQLKERPVKAEEMADVRDVTGLSFAEWMKQNPQATREQMLDFARENRVRVKKQEMAGDSKYEVRQDGELTDAEFATEREADAYIQDQIEWYRNEYSIDDDGMTDPNGETLYTVENEDGQFVVRNAAGYEETRYDTLRSVKNWLTDDLDSQIRAERERYEIREIEGAGYSDYTLPGGDNYRVHVLTLPGSGQRLYDTGTTEAQGAGYTSSHFRDTKNYLAHVRINDRTTPDGKSVLFAEEIQSDLHQSGRERGYKERKTKVDTTGWSVYKREKGEYGERAFISTPNGYTSLGGGILTDVADMTDEQVIAKVAEGMWEAENRNKIPSAPFKKTWHEMAFKYLLQQAVDSGADYLGWTTGEQQSERYNLAKQVNSIEWDPAEKNKVVSIRPIDGNTIEFAVKPDGTVTGISGQSSGTQFEGKSISEVVGKDLGQRILNERDGRVSGNGLKVGGEGMKGFYDRIVPQFADKYLKKYGIKTEAVTVPAGELGEAGSPTIVERPYGAPDFRWVVQDARGERIAHAASREAAVEALREAKPEFFQRVHAVRITPELKADISQYGQVQYRPEGSTESAPERPRLPGARRAPIKGERASYQNIEIGKSAKSLPKVALENDSAAVFARIDAAKAKITDDPLRLADERGYVEYFKDAGVWGDVLTAPPMLRVMLERPQEYVDLISGGYHGRLTKPGTMEAADAGLDATVEMRAAINGRPPEMITAMHHLWGILSRMLPPVEQESAWLRLISNRGILEQIQNSIDGSFSLTQEQWKAKVSEAMAATDEASNGRGNQGTANANSFYMMLANWNGMWSRVSDVYTAPTSTEAGRKFWSLNAGPVGIKNKVQRFIGLTFGIPGLIMDRWKFVELYYQQYGKAPQDYFRYSAFGTPEDPNGIYGIYGPIEGGNSAFSLAFYEGLESVLNRAIANSPELTAALGRHANLGGLHWKGWNAIKNEAVGHSSLDLTYDLALSGKNPSIEDILDQISRRDYYTEGLVGNRIVRFTLPKP
jgi:hypothetical protein